MSDQQAKPSPRSAAARQFDAMTLALLAVLLCITAYAVAAIGPDEALHRVGCGLTASGLLVYPGTCR